MLYGKSEAEQLAAVMETLNVIVSCGQTDIASMNTNDYALWANHCHPEAFELGLKQEVAQEHIKNFDDTSFFGLLGTVLEAIRCYAGRTLEEFDQKTPEPENRAP